MGDGGGGAPRVVVKHWIRVPPARMRLVPCVATPTNPVTITPPPQIVPTVSDFEEPPNGQNSETKKRRDTKNADAVRVHWNPPSREIPVMRASLGSVAIELVAVVFVSDV